jgi:hypothetical protein
MIQLKGVQDQTRGTDFIVTNHNFLVANVMKQQGRSNICSRLNDVERSAWHEDDEHEDAIRKSLST